MDGAGLTGYALTVDPVPDRKSLEVGNIETPPGWHGLRSSYIPYYNRAAVLTCIASGVASGIWYVLDVLRRCDTLQRGASGIIAVCVGLVFAAVEWGKSQEKPLQDHVRCFIVLAV